MKSLDTLYRGRRFYDGKCIIEALDPPGIPGRRPRWRRVSPLPSLKLRNHSPTGFEWGYGGSGPAQTALALLLDFSEDKKLAELLHQDYKSRVIAGLPRRGWELLGAGIFASIQLMRDEKVRKANQ